MGLIKDSIGSALGANRINNGLNGPFTKKPRPGMADTSSMSTGGPHPQPPSYNETPPYNPNPSFDIYPSDFPAQHFDQSNAAFPQHDYEYDHLNASNQYFRSPSPFTSAPAPAPAHFRPLALPQIANGDGQPFLRGYSEELARFGVQRNEFIELLDAINVAIIPNPEHQIFQKGANIAGWFIPGTASIGLMAGQIGVGIGAAAGHVNVVSKALAQANLKMFLPKGLEICIGKSNDVDNECGMSSQHPFSDHNMRAEERIWSYGDRLASVSVVLPSVQKAGRQDPIAMLGRGIASRDQGRKEKKADKKAGKGKTKDSDSIEAGLKWLMVRKASPEALQYWQQTMQQQQQPQDTYPIHG